MESKKGSRIVWRLVTTVLLIAVYWGFSATYNMFAGSIEGSAAVGQIQDSTVSYGMARAVGSGLIPMVAGWIFFILLILIWVSFIISKVSSSWRQKTTVSIIALFVVALVSTGCHGPGKVHPLVEIEANQTCFLIPLEGQSKDDQRKFMSVEYLNQNKVAAKRVELPVTEHKIGWHSWNFEWVPTMKVICVDRTPITREWTKTDKTGTTTTDQAVSVESIESINFKLGVTVTGIVTEDDAATFQYWFAGKPLAQVMDENVRGFAVTFLSREFGKITLDSAREKKADIFGQLEKSIKEEFKTKGITITNIGSSEGLAYDDALVQDSINKAWTAKRDRDRAEVERETALIQADKDAKSMLIRAEGTAKANRTIQNSLTGAIIKLRQIEQWDGHLPKVVGSGSLPMIDIKD